MTLPEAIQAHLGTAQAETARRLGLPRQAWFRYLQGRSAPSLSTVEAWLRVLHLSATWTAEQGWSVAPSL